MFKEILSVAKTSINLVVRRDEGLSLIEMAIGLIVLGLLVTPLIRTFKTDIISRSVGETKSALAVSSAAINQFLVSGNGSYPCPANLLLKDGDDGFGESVDCSAAAACSGTWVASGLGICKKGGDGPNAIVIGAVPFASMKMQQEKTLDFWGNKIMYAVTLYQTNNATFADDDGEITVLVVDHPKEVYEGTADGVPEEYTDVGDFFLYSTGSNGRGGYTKDGVALAACGDAAVDGYENENCNWIDTGPGDVTFFIDRNPDLKDANAFSTNEGVTMFDDITLLQVAPDKALWFQHPENTTYSDDYVITFSNKVGVGTSTPSIAILDTGLPIELDIAVDVVGNVRTEGRIISDSICDSLDPNDFSTQKCFDPELITGTKSEMRCDADDSMYGKQGVMKLSDSQVVCNSATNNVGTVIEGVAMRVDTSKINPKECDTGEIVIKILQNGEVHCDIP